MLQARGAGITASVPDADTVPAATPRGCQAEYLDQPVTPYTVNEQLHDSQILPLGDAQWQAICTPGRTPGHLCLWQPDDERPLIAGDSLPDDVGWVSTALDGPDAAAAALACRELRLMENRAEPEHLRAGPMPWQSAAQTQIVGARRPRVGARMSRCVISPRRGQGAHCRRYARQAGCRDRGLVPRRTGCSECRTGFIETARTACGGQLFHQTGHATGRRSTRPIVDTVGDLAQINFLWAVAWLRTIAVRRS